MRRVRAVGRKTGERRREEGTNVEEDRKEREKGREVSGKREEEGDEGEKCKKIEGVKFIEKQER